MKHGLTQRFDPRDVPALEDRAEVERDAKRRLSNQLFDQYRMLVPLDDIRVRWVEEPLWLVLDLTYVD